MQVADVVMLVGYIDLSSFSRLIQRWCGVSPSGFRKRIREIERRAGAAPRGVFGWYYWRRCWDFGLSVEGAGIGRLP